jgi:hypothetical protein
LPSSNASAFSIIKLENKLKNKTENWITDLFPVSLVSSGKMSRREKSVLCVWNEKRPIYWICGVPEKIFGG